MSAMGQGSFDAIEDWYDAQVRSGALLHDLALPSLDNIVGEARGKQVLDLACGQGVLARRLASRGAIVVGVDVADRLLEIARREEAAAPLGVEYRRDDAQTLASVPDASCDGVAFRRCSSQSCRRHFSLLRRSDVRAAW